MLSLGFCNRDIALRPWVWDPEMVVEEGRSRQFLQVPETQEKLKRKGLTFLWEVAHLSLTSLWPSPPATETEKEGMQARVRVLVKHHQLSRRCSCSP